MVTRDRILDILCQVTRAPEVREAGSLRLFESGLLDSMQTVELIVALGDALGIDISPADFDPAAWATPDLLVADITSRAAREA